MESGAIKTRPAIVAALIKRLRSGLEHASKNVRERGDFRGAKKKIRKIENNKRSVVFVYRGGGLRKVSSVVFYIPD